MIIAPSPEISHADLNQHLSRCTSISATVGVLSQMVKDKQFDSFVKILGKVNLTFNFRDKEDTALFVALGKDLNKDLLEALIKKVNPNLKRPSDEAALEKLFLESNNLDVFKLLGEKHFKHKMKDNHTSENILACKAKKGHFNIVKYLISTEPQLFTNLGFLTQMIKENQWELMRNILEYVKEARSGNKIGFVDEDGNHLVLIAAAHATPIMFSVIYRSGIFNGAMQNRAGRNLVLEAAYQGNAELMKYFINAAKANPNTHALFLSIDSRGQNVVQIAQERGKAIIVSLLQQSGLALVPPLVRNLCTNQRPSNAGAVSGMQQAPSLPNQGRQTVSVLPTISAGAPIPRAPLASASGAVMPTRPIVQYLPASASVSGAVMPARLFIHGAQYLPAASPPSVPVAKPPAPPVNSFRQDANVMAQPPVREQTTLASLQQYLSGLLNNNNEFHCLAAGAFAGITGWGKAPVDNDLVKNVCYYTGAAVLGVCFVKSMVKLGKFIMKPNQAQEEENPNVRSANRR